MNENSVTSQTGTGANIDIYCGFTPGRVTVTNIDSAQGDGLSWLVGMADGSAFKTAAGARSKITTGGITLLKDPVFGFGYRIGPDAAVNIAGQRIVAQAERGGEGNQTPNNPAGF